jgi:4-aminobutyrate aminotransferase-like enzyme
LVSLERSYHGTTALCDKVSHLHSTGKVKKADAAVVFLKPNNEYMLYKMLGPSMSGIIIEAIQGVGGNIPLQSAYLQKMFALAKYYNIITICDEVQTGFGRTGDTFWAFTQALAGSGYAPDIITGGKPMANGYPMGVCIIREDLAALLGDSYFNTFGGNSVACKVAWTVLRELEEKQLIKHCQELGAYLFQELSKLPFIAAVTGRGLFLGITLKPPYDSIKLVEKLKDQHILVGLGADAAANPGEISQPIIRIKPPLVVTKANLDFFLATLQQCILYKN